MNTPASFRPPRQRGMLFHGLLIVGLGAASGLAFFFGLNQKIGAYFVLLLVTSLLLFAPLPFIIYRLYALLRANYRLERDGLRLRWGMRAEDIPLTEIEWVRRPADLAAGVTLPRVRWPGAILGTVTTNDLGQIEYLASTEETLVLIATNRRVYAVSPEDPEAFIRAFQHTFEMGSLMPLSSVSVLPAAYLTRVLADVLARTLLLSGFVLNLLLFVGVSLAIPRRLMVSLGFQPSGVPMPPVSAEQMLLLPILAAFLYLIDLTTGLFFYHRDETRFLAYLVWASGVLTTLLFLLASFWILAVSG